MIRSTKMELAKPPTKQFDVGASIHNRFDVEVVDAKTGKIKQRAFAENVICDQLWTRLCSSNTYNTHIHYGDGSGTPSSSDTSLFNFLGYGQSSVYSRNYDYDTQVFSVTTKIQLSETTAVGNTLTEVGIAYSSASSSLVTHAMLKDMNGNPVSLEKSDTDVVNIYATVFIHLSLPVGVRYTGALYVSQWGAATAFSGFMTHFAGLTSMPQYRRAVPSLGYIASNLYLTLSATYDVQARSITLTCARAGVDKWNNSRGIKSLNLAVGYYTATEFIFDVEEGAEWYPKTSIKGEAIGTGDGATTDFSTKFGFAKNVTIYVDGAPVESSVDPNYGHGIGHYLRLVKSPTSACYSTSDASSVSDLLYAKGIDTFGMNVISAYEETPPIYENVLHATHGISEISGFGGYKNLNAKVSNDLENWVNLPNTEYRIAVPTEYQHYRYWSFACTNTSVTTETLRFESAQTMPSSNNVHLAEAPPDGATITADYDAICIGKDENHVLDFSVTFKFNEYSDQ